MFIPNFRCSFNRLYTSSIVLKFSSSCGTGYVSFCDFDVVLWLNAIFSRCFSNCFFSSIVPVIFSFLFSFKKIPLLANIFVFIVCQRVVIYSSLFFICIFFFVEKFKVNFLFSFFIFYLFFLCVILCFLFWFFLHCFIHFF